LHLGCEPLLLRGLRLLLRLLGSLLPGLGRRTTSALSASLSLHVERKRARDERGNCHGAEGVNA
jgi:hypothetical protein